MLVPINRGNWSILPAKLLTLAFFPNYFVKMLPIIVSKNPFLTYNTSPIPYVQSVKNAVTYPVLYF